MYCSTCELEIKGDDKDTCPVCGALLSDSHDDDSALNNQDRDHPAIQEIVEDINGLIEQDEPLGAADSEEEVFVLKDYAPDALKAEEGGVLFDGDDEPQTPEMPLLQDTDSHPPLLDGSQGSESVSEILDSIRESIAMPEHDEEEPVARDENSSGPDEDFGLFDSDKPDFSDFADSDTTSDERAERAWGFDDAADALPVPEAPARKRSPAFMIVLIIVLLAVGGYYAMSMMSGDAGRDDGRTVRTVMPLAELQTDVQHKQAVEENLSTPAADVIVPDGEAQLPASVHGDALQSAQVDSQPPAFGKPVETVASPAPAASAVAEETAAVQSGPAPAEVAKPVETPAPVKPEALPASAPVAAAEAVSVQSGPAPAEVVKPVVSAAPVRAPFYTVHVGSYRTKAAASAEAERIKAKGHDAFVERADLGRRGIWYRVKVGRFKIRSEAEQLRKKIHKVLVQDSMVVTNRTD